MQSSLQHTTRSNTCIDFSARTHTHTHTKSTKLNLSEGSLLEYVAFYLRTMEHEQKKERQTAVVVSYSTSMDRKMKLPRISFHSTHILFVSSSLRKPMNRCTTRAIKKPAFLQASFMLVCVFFLVYIFNIVKQRTNVNEVSLILSIDALFRAVALATCNIVAQSGFDCILSPYHVTTC